MFSDFLIKTYHKTQGISPDIGILDKISKEKINIDEAVTSDLNVTCKKKESS